MYRFSVWKIIKVKVCILELVHFWPHVSKGKKHLKGLKRTLALQIRGQSKMFPSYSLFLLLHFFSNRTPSIHSLKNFLYGKVLPIFGIFIFCVCPALSIYSLICSSCHVLLSLRSAIPWGDVITPQRDIFFNK